MFGAALSLTVTESMHGLDINQGKVIVDYKLIERVITRTAECKVTIVESTETNCHLDFFYGGRIVGQSILPASEVKAPVVTKEILYQRALARGARTHLSKLFGTKFFILAELNSPPAEAAPAPVTLPKGAGAQAVAKIMQQAGHPVATADQAPAPKPKTQTVIDTTTNEFMAGLTESNRNALLAWQNKIDTLSDEHPGQWDAHRFDLGQMSWLKEAEMIDLFGRFRIIAESKHIGYNETDRRFYLAEDSVFMNL